VLRLFGGGARRRVQLCLQYEQARSVYSSAGVSERVVL
jgi:hypothetical protein